MIPTKHEFREFLYLYIENFIKKEINRGHNLSENKCIFIDNSDYYVVIAPDGTNALKSFNRPLIVYIYNIIITIGDKFEEKQCELLCIALFNYLKYENLHDYNYLLDIDHSIYYTYICKQEFLLDVGIEIMPNMDIFYEWVKYCNKKVWLCIFLEYFIDGDL